MVKTKLLLIIFLLSKCILSAQGADNSFHGYYKADHHKTIDDSFSFDGTGKVLIAGMDYGDYFTRNDSLIVSRNQSISIFKIKKDQLTGISNGVEKDSWTHQIDAPEIQKPYDSVNTRKKAELLAGYYDKTKSVSISDPDFSAKISEVNERFCRDGLAMACLNLFESKMIEHNSELLGTPKKNPSKKIEPYLELVLLSQRIVELGDPEGYTVLGSYYNTLGLKKEAFENWDEGEKNGSLQSARLKATIQKKELKKKK